MYVGSVTFWAVLTLRAKQNLLKLLHQGYTTRSSTCHSSASCICLVSFCGSSFLVSGKEIKYFLPMASSSRLVRGHSYKHGQKRLHFDSFPGVRLEGEGHAVRSGIGGGRGPDGSSEMEGAAQTLAISERVGLGQSRNDQHRAEAGRGHFLVVCAHYRLQC